MKSLNSWRKAIVEMTEQNTIDTSPAALRKLADEYLGDYEDTKVMRDTLLAVAAEKEAQHHIADASKMVAPAEVQQPEPTLSGPAVLSRNMVAQSDSGHGHVRPRKDGCLARCGGPAMCKVCQQELAEIATPASADVPLPEPLYVEVALDAARLAMPEFSQHDDYLLAHGASLMSEDSHEILHQDTLRRIVAAAVATERERLTRKPLPQTMLIHLWGDRSDGPSNAELVSFARAVERAHGIEVVQANQKGTV